MTFRKPGRPREDRVARRLEIFELVAPSLERLGPRIAMRDAARAAHVSVGTLYTYFGSKRELLLYGLNQEPVDLICRRFEAEHADLAMVNPPRYRSLVLDLMTRNILAMRSSVDSAMLLGPDVARSGIDGVIHRPIPAFVAIIRRALPEAERSRAEAIEQTLRHVVAAALVERDVSVSGLRIQLRDVLFGPAEPNAPGLSVRDVGDGASLRPSPERRAQGEREHDQ